MKKSSFFELPDKMFGLDTALMIIFVKPVALLIVAVILFNLVVFPRIEEYDGLIASAASTEAKTKTYQQKINYLRSVDQESLKRDEDLVASALMPEKNSYYLVNVVRKIADRYGFRVDSFSVNLGELENNPEEAQIKDVKGYASIPVSLTMIGPKDQYYELALGLEKSLPILTIGSFDMKNLGVVSTIEMTVNGFYISEKKLVESDKLTLADLTLKQEETELVSKLGEFEVLTDVGDVVGRFDKQKEFVKYNREDPFSQ